MGANWGGMLIVLIFVTLWHELGHLCAARILHVPVKRIGIGFGPILWRFAGTAQTEVVLRVLPLGMSLGIPGRRDERGQLRRPVAHDLWMAAAGPLASLLLTGLLLAAAFWLPLPLEWRKSLVITGLLSAVLAILNLIPVPGLDGGHLAVLSAARLGWVLTPAQERRLHRWGMNFMLFACLVPLVLLALGRLGAPV